MHSKNNAIKRTVFGLLFLIAIFAGLYSFKVVHENRHHIDKALFNGTLLDRPRSISEFELQGIDGEVFNNASLVGNWTMLFFGFTNCGYVCPTTMAELGKTYRLLESQNSKILPRVVMITLDPKRDSLDKLAQYVRAFDRHFYGARGEQKAIQGITKDLGVAYAEVEVKTSTNTTKKDIEHTGAIMLFNPQGKLIAFFTGPHSAEKIANDFKLLIS